MEHQGQGSKPRFTNVSNTKISACYFMISIVALEYSSCGMYLHVSLKILRYVNLPYATRCITKGMVYKYRLNIMRYQMSTL